MGRRAMSRFASRGDVIGVSRFGSRWTDGVCFRMNGVSAGPGEMALIRRPSLAGDSFSSLEAAPAVERPGGPTAT